MMSFKKEIKYFLLLKLLVPAGYWFLSLYSRTLRVKIENADMVISSVKNGHKLVLASWHQRFYGGFFIPRALAIRPCIMISLSRDGDYIAGVVKRIGWLPVRGSGSRGGREALREMAAGVVSQKVGGHIVDGPTGPPRVVKPGLIALAQRAGASICPAYVSYENPWIFRSWDRFMVPKPFTGVRLVFSELIEVPPELDEAAFEKFRLHVEKKMIEGYREADRYWESKRKPSRSYACFPVE